MELGNLLKGIQKSLVAKGLELKMLEATDRLTPDQLYESIKGDVDVAAFITPEVRLRIVGLLRQMPSFGNKVLDAEYIVRTVGDRHPELRSILLNTPGGGEWLKRQVDKLRQALT